MKKRPAKKKPTLKDLDRRVRNLERRLRDVADEAGYAYARTMRVGGTR